MFSTARIEKELNSSDAMDLALVTPAVEAGFGALDNAYTTIEPYSQEAADGIPFGAEAGLWRKIALGLTPLFVAFGWVAFFKSLKQLWQAKEKNFELWMNASVNFFAAAGATIITIFLLTSLASVVPYILVGVLALNALQGLYYMSKHLLLAYRNQQERWHHLKEAGKHFLGIAINALAMTLNLLVFHTAKILAGALKEYAGSALSLLLHYTELVNFINGPVMTAVSAIKGVGLAWFGVFMLRFVMAASNINRETVQMVRERRLDVLRFEREAIADLRQIIGMIKDPAAHPMKRLFLFLTLPVTMPVYALTTTTYSLLLRPTAAVVVGIPELLCRGVYLGMKRLFSEKASEEKEQSQHNTSSRVMLAFPDEQDEVCVREVKVAGVDRRSLLPWHGTFKLGQCLQSCWPKIKQPAPHKESFEYIREEGSVKACDDIRKESSVKAFDDIREESSEKGKRFSCFGSQ